MPLQIANPAVVHKVERLGLVNAMNQTTTDERTVDQLPQDTDSRPAPTADESQDRLSALLAQMDRIPELPQAGEVPDWDDLGLPT